MHDLDLHGVARVNHLSPHHFPHSPNIFKEGEQKIIAKLAIYPNMTAIWLSAKNRYKVNWGDGSSANYASGAIANHNYDFDTLNCPIHSDGYKEVTVTITPQNRYNLTEINFDPQPTEEDVQYLSTAAWIQIDGSMPKLCATILSTGKAKMRHPLLKKYSIRM